MAGRGSGKSKAWLVALPILALIAMIAIGVGWRQLPPNLDQTAAGAFGKASGAAEVIATKAADLARTAGLPVATPPTPAKSAPTPAAPSSAHESPKRVSRSTSPSPVAASSHAAPPAPPPSPATPPETPASPDVSARPPVDVQADVPTDATTYTADDSDVTPPVLRNEHLPAGLRTVPIGIGSDNLVISIVVDEHGIVDVAKPVTTPRSLGESLALTDALSAVKSWQFAPATKDGRPVRFQQTITLGR
jgi:hypothetical protein